MLASTRTIHAPPAAVHPVDERLPAPKPLALKLHHVLVMYAGAVAVPLIIGRALGLPPEGVAALVDADLFVAGIARGLLADVSVLVSIVAGSAAACLMGEMGFAAVARAGGFALVAPFAFGMPRFDPVARLTPSVVMAVVVVSAGMFLALGDITGRPADRAAMTRGLRVDGLGTALAGVLNSFPQTCFSQSVGLVGVTGVRSRSVTAVCGALLLAMGLAPKLGAPVAAAPLFVLGGAGIVMSGTVAATGIRIPSEVDHRTDRSDLYVAAVSSGFGMIPIVAPHFFGAFPDGVGPVRERARHAGLPPRHGGEGPDVMDAVGSDDLFLQYDVYHRQRSGGGLIGTSRALKDRIARVQVADNPGRHEPGTGEIDCAVFDALDREGYAGWVGCGCRPAGNTSAGLGWPRGRP